MGSDVVGGARAYTYLPTCLPTYLPTYLPACTVSGGHAWEDHGNNMED